jgi:hypothetical protein
MRKAIYTALVISMTLTVTSLCPFDRREKPVLAFPRMADTILSWGLGE